QSHGRKLDLPCPVKRSHFLRELGQKRGDPLNEEESCTRAEEGNCDGVDRVDERCADEYEDQSGEAEETYNCDDSMLSCSEFNYRRGRRVKRLQRVLPLDR